MKTGFDLLLPDNSYTYRIVADFEKVLGILPVEYKELIVNYKTGYPCLNTNEDIEVIARLTGESFFIEAFITLPEVMDKLGNLDIAYGLSGNHRKYGLLPICTSGSSYRNYYLKRDNASIYVLNPNQDIDTEINIEKHKLTNRLNDFIKSFIIEEIDY